MPRVPAHLREHAVGMLQGGMRTADVARAINCNVCTVRRLSATGRQDRQLIYLAVADHVYQHLHRIGTSEHHTCRTGTGWAVVAELHQEHTIPLSVLRLSAIG